MLVQKSPHKWCDCGVCGVFMKSTPKPKESITSQNVEQQTVTQPTSPSGPSNHDEENVPHFVTHWGGLTVYISGYPRLGKIDCMKL